MVYTLIGIDINNHFTFLGNFYDRKIADKYSNELNYNKYALFYVSDTSQKNIEIDQEDDIISVETRRDNAFEAQQKERKMKKEDNALKQKKMEDKEFNDFLNSDTFSKLSKKEQEQVRENTQDSVLYQVLRPMEYYETHQDKETKRILELEKHILELKTELRKHRKVGEVYFESKEELDERHRRETEEDEKEWEEIRRRDESNKAKEAKKTKEEKEADKEKREKREKEAKEGEEKRKAKLIYIDL